MERSTLACAARAFAGQLVARGPGLALGAALAVACASLAAPHGAHAASVTTVNRWTIRDGVDTGTTLFEVTEVFTPAADLGGSDNRYEYTVRNATSDLAANGFRVANPDNLPKVLLSPPGWTARTAQNFFWDGGPLAPGATQGGFVVLTPGLIPELTAANGFNVAAGEAGFIVTDASGTRVDVFGPVSHLGTLMSSTPILIAGVDVLSSSTAERASSSTSLPAIQLRTVAPLLANLGTRTSLWLQQTGARPVPVSTAATTGMAAGETELGIRVWGNVEGRSFRDTFPTTAFEADVHALTVGADMPIGDSILVGVVAAYEDQEVDTFFNTGSQTIDQYQGAVYGGWLFGERFSLDGAIGYARMDIEQDRGLPGFGIISSSTDGHRWFASVNLNAYYELGPALLDASTGVLYARDRLAAFTESNGLVNPGQTTRLGQWRIGVQITLPLRQRLLGGDLSLYASTFHVKDFERTRVRVAPNQLLPRDDDTELELATGVRYQAGESTTASLEYVTVLGRASFESRVLSGNLSVSF